MQDLRFQTAEILAKQLAFDLAERMRLVIQRKGKVAIALSGGRTPVAFLQQLSKQALAWDRVTVTLVDERWLEPSDEASNERLLRQYLLQGAAQNAWFIPLKTTQAKVSDGFMTCELRLQEQLGELDYAVLGLGNDGHTASWFPRSKALAQIFNQQSSALCCPVVDAPEFERMTLTWHALAHCRHLFLHFQGDDKNHVFAQAIQAEQLTDYDSMPVRFLFTQQQVPLSIYRTL